MFCRADHTVHTLEVTYVFILTRRIQNDQLHIYIFIIVLIHPDKLQS